ncbi:MAG TPA: patatin [bacterium]|nr:patatin [bacterium]
MMKIGLALGGGAVYGLAHIGVLKVLEKSGIRPDFIAGTSVGSIIGALYAAGQPPDEIEKIANEFEWYNIASPTIPKEGLLSIEKLEDFVKKHAGAANIEDTRIKLAVVTTNLINGKERVFTEGLLGPAVRASCSLPGLFNPVYFRQGVYVDGGIVNNVPTDAVKKMGADFVIGVDVLAKSTMDVAKRKDIFSITWRSWQVTIVNNTKNINYPGADYIIKPEIDDVYPFDMTKKKSIIDIGEMAAEKAVKEILNMIKGTGTFADRVKRIFHKKQ